MEDSNGNGQNLDEAEIERLERSAGPLAERMRQARQALREGEDRVASFLKYNIPMKRDRKL